MFCAGLLLSIADLLRLNTRLPVLGPEAGFEIALFPEAFPPPRKQVGDNAAANVSYTASVPGSNVTTIRAISGAFNWKFGIGPSG
jgi:hypothetical protein